MRVAKKSSLCIVDCNTGSSIWIDKIPASAVRSLISCDFAPKPPLNPLRQKEIRPVYLPRWTIQQLQPVGQHPLTLAPANANEKGKSSHATIVGGESYNATAKCRPVAVVPRLAMQRIASILMIRRRLHARMVTVKGRSTHISADLSNSLPPRWEMRFPAWSTRNVVSSNWKQHWLRMGTLNHWIPCNDGEIQSSLSRRNR